MRKLAYVFNGIFALGFLSLAGWLFFGGEPWVWLGAVAISLFHIHAIKLDLDSYRLSVLQSTLLKLLNMRHSR